MAINETQIWERQKALSDKAVEFCIKNPRCYIYAFAGFGKTIIAKRVIHELKPEHILYIMPAAVLAVNESRFKDIPNVELISYQSLHKTKRSYYDLVIADEADYLKQFRVRGGSSRAKQAYRIISQSARFIGLTATLYREDPECLYGMQMFVDGGKALGRYFKDFSHKYFDVHTEHGKNYSILKMRKDTLENIIEDMGHSVFCIRYSDMFGEIPEYSIVYHDFKQDDHIIETIKSFIKNKHVGNRIKSAGMVDINLQLQMASGFYYDGVPKIDGTVDRIVTQLGTKRQEFCADTIKKLNVPVILIANFEYEQESMSELLNALDIPNFVYGAATAVQRKKAIQDFNRGKYQVLIAHPESLGVGVDGLQEVCSDIMFFNQGVSLRSLYQSTARISTPRQFYAGNMHRIPPKMHVIRSQLAIERQISSAIEKKEEYVADFKINMLSKTV